MNLFMANFKVGYRTICRRILFVFSLHCFFSFAASAVISGPEEKDTLVQINTRFGQITVLLFRETPFHRANFLRLAAENSYDSTTFYHIKDDFMIQGGDFKSKEIKTEMEGQGAYGKSLPPELNSNFSHIQGALAAVKSGESEKGSTDSRFYLVEHPSGMHFLDQENTVFGQTLNGLEIIQAIAEQPVDVSGKPIRSIRMWMKILPMKKEKVAETYGWDYKRHCIRQELKLVR
jgi:cyclophilin family peptidyl-prolyl cis-trans isomerase